MHFVDPGLMQPGLFPQYSLEPLLKVAPKMKVFFHGTPRQFMDEQRPFVRQEALSLHQRLKKAGFATAFHEYFQGEVPSLEMHFNALKVFKTDEGCKLEETEEIKEMMNADIDAA